MGIFLFLGHLHQAVFHHVIEALFFVHTAHSLARIERDDSRSRLLSCSRTILFAPSYNELIALVALFVFAVIISSLLLQLSGVIFVCCWCVHLTIIVQYS